MADKKLGIEFDVTVKGDGVIHRVESDIRKLDTAEKELEKTLGAVSHTLEATVSDMKRMEAEVAKAGKATEKFGSDIAKTAKSLYVMETASDTLLASQKKLGLELLSTEKTTITLRVALQELKQAGVQPTETAYKSLVAEIERSEASLRETKEQITAVNSGLEKGRKTVDDYRQAITKAGITTEQLNDSLQQEDQTLVSLDDEIQRQYQSISALETAMKALKARGVDETDASFAALESQASDLRSELNRLEGGVSEIEDDAVSAAKAVDKMGDELQQTGNQASTADKKMDNFGSTIFKASTLANLAADAMQEISRAVVEFTKESARAYLDYEDKTRRVFAQIPELSAAMRESLSRDARVIATEIGYLPSEVLPALRKAMNLGISEDNIMSAIETASMAARIGGSDLTETLVLGQSVVNAYGEGIYTLAESYDLLNYITQSTNLEFTDLNAGMNQIISPAAEAGLALEDVAAMMIVMNRQGDDMNEIMDLLGPALTRIAVSTSASGAAFKEIAGVGFREFIEQGHTVVEAFQLIQDESDRTGKSIIEMMSSGSDLYADTQTARAIAELTGRHLPELEQAYLDTARAKGTLSTASAEFADSDTLAVAQMTAAYESMKIESGKAALVIATNAGLIEGAIAVFQALSGDAAYSAVGTAQETRDQAAALEELTAARNDLLSIGLSPDVLGMDVVDEQIQETVKEMVRAGATWEEVTGSFTTPDGFIEELMAWNEEIMRQRAGLEPLIPTLENLEAILVDIAEEEAAAAREAEAFALGLNTAEGSLQRYLSTASTAGDPSIMRDRLGFKDALEDVHNFVDVLEVLDGDTFKVKIDGEIESVRFANINTAEIAHEAGEMAMPYAQAAMDFTQKYVDENPVELDIKVGEETYGRIIASIPELESRLVAEGLAIPVPFELSGDQVRVDELTIAMQAAAEAGKGMFADPILQAKALSGELVYLNEYYEEMAATNKEMFADYREAATLLKPLEEAYDDLADAQGEWAEYSVDNSAKVASISAELAADLTDDQEDAYKEILATVDEGSAEWLAAYDGLQNDLTESQRNALVAQKGDFLSAHGEIQQGYTGDARAAEEAEEAIVAAQGAIQKALQQTALSAYEARLEMTDPAALESYLALQVELGNVTQAYASQRVEMMQMTAQAEELGASEEFATLGVEAQAKALEYLTGGMADTAERAIELATVYDENLSESLANATDSSIILDGKLAYLSDQEYKADMEMEGLDEGIAQADNLADSLNNAAGSYSATFTTHRRTITYEEYREGERGEGAAGGVKEGYATGGYTGNGDTNDIAGIVHAGEYVFSADAVDTYGVAALDMMHQAARSGGAVAPAAAIETGATTSTELPPIIMNQYFYGQTEPDAVYDAARGGADDALEMARAMGRA